MKNKKILRGVVIFLAGAISTCVVQLYYPGVKDALADQYACIRQDLDAKLHSGNIPDATVSLVYAIPSCYGSNGYKINKVSIYQGNMVRVDYVNPSKSAGSYGKGAGGGLRAIP